MQSPLVALLIDDHAPFVKDLIGEISSHGLRVEFIRTGEELLERLDRDHFACVIVELGQEHPEGLRVLEEIHRKHIPLASIALIENSEIDAIIDAVRHGIVTLLLRESAGRQEVQFVLNTAAEKTARLRLDSEQRATRRARFAELTTGESEVLEGLVQGLKLISIAEALDLSRRTVELRRARIMQKLEVATFPELIALSIEYERDRQNS